MLLISAGTQISLWDLIPDTSERDSLPTPIVEVPAHTPPVYTQWVSIYDKRVRGKQIWYVRYYWMSRHEGKLRTNHIHIPGGHADTPIVQRRRSEVERLIAEGQSPLYIRRAIVEWSEVHHRGWNLNQNRKIPSTIPPCFPQQVIPGSLPPGR